MSEGRQLASAAHRPSPIATPSPSPSRIILALGALALMLIAANCFLKYLWWTACYSAWAGIPKLASQWRAAGARSSFYGWSVIVLELASLILLYTAIRLGQVTFSTFLRTALRLAASLTISVIGTGLLALVLSWVKQSH